MLGALHAFETDIDRLEQELKVAQAHPETTLSKLKSLIDEKSQIDERAMKYIGEQANLMEAGPVSIVKIVKRMLEASQESLVA